jgi:hypothetical protein
MSSWLDIVSSFVLGIAVIFLLMNVNIQIQSSANEKLMNNITQLNSSSDIRTFDHIFYKIGNNVSEETFALVDSNKIIFNGDYNDDNEIDTLSVYTGTKSQLTWTQNPDDYPVFYQINNDSPILIAWVTSFKFTYLDTLGKAISSSLLMDSLGREAIRIVQIDSRTQSAFPLEGRYQSVDNRKLYFPKNLAIKEIIDPGDEPDE